MYLNWLHIDFLIRPPFIRFHILAFVAFSSSLFIIYSLFVLFCLSTQRFHFSFTLPLFSFILLHRYFPAFIIFFLLFSFLPTFKILFHFTFLFFHSLFSSSSPSSCSATYGFRTHLLAPLTFPLALFPLRPLASPRPREAPPPPPRPSKWHCGTCLASRL